jgi:hypothetical protein
MEGHCQIPYTDLVKNYIHLFTLALGYSCPHLLDREAIAYGKHPVKRKLWTS